ncbi:MAG: primosome assembly protein PriA, primosomal protein N' [Candidatus Peregrinibacteria bacterium GW2011_GWF2_43_17]|nr:MAG: primosome assembly protein PriA, primosomal protein N' [Candidatus Peregrinibacteria bacterium GW2011_GWF2_43_17]KKT20295.1 MAG: Primosomal protein N' [Candidatus Peregrinibacteria bacterium GW2011_GWA2_43_8]HAU39448.1 primosomal protein N' [Candidatus Peregrinibacteria bacterium]
MFADILLNQKYSQLKETFTYEVDNLQVGSVVMAPYGKKKLGGIIINLSDQKPNFKTRKIEEINRIYPQMPNWQFQTALFIKDYYLSSIYKCFKLFIPDKIWNLRGKFGIEKEKNETIKLPHLTLTDLQKKALKSIESDSANKFLIHGITGSGKTEIYLHLAYKLAKEGKQTLILVPEISLTPQTRNYFKKIFKNKTSIIHSQLTESQKVKEWIRIKEGLSSVIIGSRSALFLPFKNLGAIVIDEEHDLSYKQDQNPRYDARTVAEKIADLLKIKLILASATPSIETYQKALSGKLKLLNLEERIGGTKLPKVKIVDMREELKKKNFGIFSEELEKELRKILANKRQAILFLNRRGTASSITCRECGFSPECENCSVKMTYHFYPKTNSGILLCHHCASTKKSPLACPTCGSIYIKNIGLGTERVEQEIYSMFPGAKVLRADKDTVKTRDDFPAIYKKFQEGSADILIGTQMIGKGLDIEKVDLVAVILADIGLHVPDFRAQEYTFHTLTQVAGRAGRRESRGTVIFQTYTPDNFAIQASKDHDYKKLFKKEISIREKHNLPPFYKIIKLTYTGDSLQTSKQKILKSAEIFAKSPGIEISMAPALIAKRHGKYHYNLFLKAKKFEKETKEQLAQILKSDENFKVDIDPLITT